MTDPTTRAALAAVARIRQMTDAWEQSLPETIRTPAVVSALRVALETVPAVSLPPADQTALPVAEARDRLRGMALTFATGEGPLVEPWAFNQALDDYQAAVAAAVLPATTDQTAVLAEAIRRVEEERDAVDVRFALYPRYDRKERAALEGALRVLRRLADETPAAETEADERKQPVYLSTPCAVCTHPYNWHCGQPACQFGRKGDLCGCRSFTPSEEPAAGARQDGEA